jgi:hypothetical protein
MSDFSINALGNDFEVVEDSYTVSIERISQADNFAKINRILHELLDEQASRK